jgi:L-fuconolactonase
VIGVRVDAHQHFWKVERGDYGWLTPSLKPLYKDFLPDDLQPHLQKYRIDRTIVVQAAPTTEETDFLLQLYREHERIAGVVGWLDLESPDFHEIFLRYREREGFIGIRPMLQDLEDDRWILRPTVLKNIEILVQEDFPIDILIKPRHLPSIIELLRLFPTLRAVIDHMAKPYIAAQILDPWREQMREVASFPQVMCKLSGMITEADPSSWKREDLKPYIHHVIEVFGTDRIMFGSDWPVCLLAGSYDDVYQALVENLPIDFSDEDRTKLFGHNALSFYQIRENRTV